MDNILFISVDWLAKYVLGEVSSDSITDDITKCLISNFSVDENYEFKDDCIYRGCIFLTFKN